MIVYRSRPTVCIVLLYFKNKHHDPEYICTYFTSVICGEWFMPRYHDTHSDQKEFRLNVHVFLKNFELFHSVEKRLVFGTK